MNVQSPKHHLNLPSKVDFGGGKYIEYIYDAAGIKLTQKVYDNITLQKTTEYMGEFIYQDLNDGNGSLCLNEQLCFYYDIQEKKFSVSINVPLHSWITDDEFLSFPIIDNSIYSRRIAAKKYDFNC